MIKYRFEEELQYLEYHFEKMGEVRAKDILASDAPLSNDDAEYLSEFFWRMVDFSIAEENSKITLPWPENREFWNEKLMNSISGFIERQGFEDVWEQVLDNQ